MLRKVVKYSKAGEKTDCSLFSVRIALLSMYGTEIVHVFEK